MADPKQDPQDPNVEEPGDTNAPDIVGRTGEQMPRQSHDGVDDEDERARREMADKAQRRRTFDW